MPLFAERTGLPRWLSGKKKKKKNCLPMQEILVLSQEDPLEKEMATYSSVLACKSPWTEKPSGL